MSTSRALVFGKLPRHGDFVARGLADAARSRWDAWAGDGLAAAQEQLGERFEPAHGAAAPWRFIGAPGPYGDGWLAGALAMSVDAVGRRYVAILGLQGLSAGEAVANGPTAAALMEDALYEVFQGGLDADQAAALIAAKAQALDPAAGAVVGAMGAAAPATGVWWTLGEGTAAGQVIAAAEPPADLLPGALQAAAEAVA